MRDFSFSASAEWVVGALLVVVARPRVGRFTARAPSGVFHIAIAGVLALGASEVALKRWHIRPGEWLLPDEEPRRRPDPRTRSRPAKRR